MANETVSEEQRILDIKVKYKDAIQSIASYKKKIDELKAAEAELKEQKKAGAITDEEYRSRWLQPIPSLPNTRIIFGCSARNYRTISDKSRRTRAV